MTFSKSSNFPVFVLLMFFFLSACTSEGQNHDHANHPEPTAQTEDSASGTNIPKEQAQEILTAYLQVKDALVQTNGEDAKQAALLLVASLGEQEAGLLHEIRVDAEHIAGTLDTGHQRDHFSSLSDNVYTMVKTTEANETPVYRQYCPMAFEGKGGFWLASEKEVNNPYFGDMMLHCGSVKEEL